MDKQLSDYEWEHHTIECYCDKCGTQLRIHPLYPRVQADMLTHACIRKPPHMRNDRFVITNQELKPYDMPTSLLLEMDYRYGKDDIK